jgi:hypothetical protein
MQSNCLEQEAISLEEYVLTTQMKAPTLSLIEKDIKVPIDRSGLWSVSPNNYLNPTLMRNSWSLNKPWS